MEKLLSGILSEIEGKLAEGRAAAQSVNILEKQKLVLRNENRRLYVKLDELLSLNLEQEKVIERQFEELARLRKIVYLGGR